MQSSFKRLVINLFVVLLSIGISIIFRFELQDILNQELPLTVFLLAVIVSVYFGGFWLGVTATILSVFAGTYFFIDPPFSFAGANQGEFYRIILFIIEGISISFLAKIIVNTKELLTNTLQQIPAGFLLLNNSWEINYINYAGKDLLHIDKLINSGKNLWDLNPSLKNTIFYKKCIGSVKGKKPSLFEYYDEKLDKWLLVHLYPSSSRITIYLTDITTKKREEQKREDFITIISHELKTPLTAISAYSQLAERKLQNEKNSTLGYIITNIRRQALSMTALIQQIMNVNMVERKKLNLKKETFFLDEMIQEIINDFKHSYPHRKIINKDNLRLEITADKEKIREVINNLLTNAFKYSQESKEVIVKTQLHDTSVTVAIKDYGPGIPENMTSKIFYRFVRLKGKGQSGLGLGLYISSEIIKKHMGKIWVESKRGKGSTFYFTLPIIKKQYM